MAHLSLMALLLAGAGMAGADQHLLYKEANLSAFYSGRDGSLRPSPQPSLSSLGFEYLWRASEELPGQLQLSVIDLYLQMAYDPGARRLVVKARDTWLRFDEPRTGLQVRLGHFALPFGLPAPRTLRGQAIPPLSELSLGFVQDWGLTVRGAWGDLRYDAATTLGSGDALRLRPGATLWAGRLGMPPFRKTQYGLSLLYGDPRRARSAPASWRAAVDGVLIYREPFTTLRGEVALCAREGRLAGGLLLGLTQILPANSRWGLEGQVRLWRGGGRRGELIAGLLRSLPGLCTFRFQWHRRSALLGGNGLFAQLYYYGP
ncbi:MAG: hypothetical protein FJY95_21275 [Candidatus Handelsmanbacteria bacterium]|nr:hypothetical protein [Candidatus Handelsmanbacteria bacterium]